MAATAAGNVPLLEALLARGADRAAVDHLGRNALHWAIATALRDRVYAATSFSPVFRLVAPAGVDVMAGERLIRIDRHQTEYLFFQIMWVLFRQCFGTAEMTDRGGIHGAMLQDAFERLPVEVVAPERTKRAYISGVLARNEVDRDYAYNRRLFKRFRTGVYQFSPALSVRRHGTNGDAWVPVFAALNLALVKETCDHHYVGHIDQLLVAGQLAPAAEPMSVAYLRAKRLAQLNMARSPAAAARKGSQEIGCKSSDLHDNAAELEQPLEMSSLPDAQQTLSEQFNASERRSRLRFTPPRQPMGAPSERLPGRLKPIKVRGSDWPGNLRLAPDRR